MIKGKADSVQWWSHSGGGSQSGEKKQVIEGEMSVHTTLKHAGF